MLTPSSPYCFASGASPTPKESITTGTASTAQAPGAVTASQYTAEQIEEAMKPERTRPDFTEVIEPEQAVQEMMENPKKAMEEKVEIVKETARKTVEADMSKLAIEPEIGEFTGGYKPSFVKKSQEKINKDAYVQNEEQTEKTNWKKIKSKVAISLSSVASSNRIFVGLSSYQ